VRDHCHEHGWVRDIVCRSCNLFLGVIDRLRVPRADERLLAALLIVRNRCPDCDQLGIADLARPEPRIMKLLRAREARAAEHRDRLLGRVSPDPHRSADVRRAIATNIRAERARTGLSQKQVADAMRDRGYHWHPQTVGLVERDERQVWADELIALAEVLGAAPDALWRVPPAG
jgi:hypothetical protein